MKKLMIISMLCASVFYNLHAQDVHVLQSGKKVSIRGLSVVTDNIIWASGSGGSVARSVDGGKNWTWITVPGYEKREFRDIEGFDSDTAVIMAVAEPAVILKTMDGGKNWKKVFEDTTKGMFLDAMDFGETGTGMVIGDPIGGIVYMAFTKDHGDTWTPISNSKTATPLTVDEGEAFFASSGTNLKMIGNHPVLVSGGKRSRFNFIDGWQELPIMQGKESTGANSIAVYRNAKIGRALHAVVVGGDFTKDTIANNNCVLVNMNPAISFSIPKVPPHGYRSCVIYLKRNKLVTCGTSGIDISKDGGNTWQLISKESFHVCQKAKKGKAVFLAGGNGRIAKLEGLR
jgi:photosystem II stability/assembly factor-like uncharacterized protein